MFNLPAISGDWSIEKMSNIKKNQALLWYSNGQSELSLLESLALGFYSDAEFFFTCVDSLHRMTYCFVSCYIDVLRNPKSVFLGPVTFLQGPRILESEKLGYICI